MLLSAFLSHQISSPIYVIAIHLYSILFYSILLHPGALHGAFIHLNNVGYIPFQLWFCFHIKHYNWICGCGQASYTQLKQPLFPLVPY